jgi:hypothetical protein
MARTTSIDIALQVLLNDTGETMNAAVSFNR